MKTGKVLVCAGWRLVSMLQWAIRGTDPCIPCYCCPQPASPLGDVSLLLWSRHVCYEPVLSGTDPLQHGRNTRQAGGQDTEGVQDVTTTESLATRCTARMRICRCSATCLEYEAGYEGYGGDVSALVPQGVGDCRCTHTRSRSRGFQDGAVCAHEGTAHYS